MTNELSRFLYADDEHKLNIQHIGTTLMIRNQSRNSSNAECIYRIIQDGLRYLVPFMNKRIIRTSCEKAFKQILMNHYHDLDDIIDKQMLNEIDKLTPGCFIIGYNV